MQKTITHINPLGSYGEAERAGALEREKLGFKPTQPNSAQGKFSYLQAV